MFGGGAIDASLRLGLLDVDLRPEDSVALLLRQDGLLLRGLLALPGQLAALAAVAFDHGPGQGGRDTESRQQPAPVGAREGKRGRHGLLSWLGSTFRLLLSSQTAPPT